MKKFAVVTLGLLLAATPAFANTEVNQDASGNQVGNAWHGSTGYSNNDGVSNSDISNASGILNESLNAGNSSNVGSATDLVITGGLTVDGGKTTIGGINDGNTQLSGAYLNQVAANNTVGVAPDPSLVDSSNRGIANVGINGSTGIVTQQINTGNSSNVGSAIGITIH